MKDYFNSINNVMDDTIKLLTELNFIVSNLTDTFDAPTLNEEPFEKNQSIIHTTLLRSEISYNKARKINENLLDLKIKLEKLNESI